MLMRDARVKEAWLFGSVARGEERPESDIDVALLAGKGYRGEELLLKMLDKHGAKVIPLVFGTKGELEGFLLGKERIKLK
jgi:predicted nucleotidyltransferase